MKDIVKTLEANGIMVTSDNKILKKDLELAKKVIAEDRFEPELPPVYRIMVNQVLDGKPYSHYSYSTKGIQELKNYNSAKKHAQSFTDESIVSVEIIEILRTAKVIETITPGK